jgi:hypothetical protein
VAVFAFAGASKLKTPIAFRSVLRGLLPAPVVLPFSYLIPIVELSVAASLAIGSSRSYGAVAAIVLLFAFCAALARMWQLGLTQDCGCFGEASTDATPRSGLIRNALLLVAAIAVLASTPASAPWDLSTSEALAALAIALGAASFWSLAHVVVSDRAILFGRAFMPTLPPAPSEDGA